MLIFLNDIGSIFSFYFFKILIFFFIWALSEKIKLNTKVAMTYKLDFQTVFQIWTNSDISYFSFRHFRKQNEKPVTVFICIHVMLSLLYLTVCQSALHKLCWDVSSGPCHNIMWKHNCGVHGFGKKCRCVVGRSRSCSKPAGLGSKRSRTLGYCEEQTSLTIRYSYCEPN